MTEPISTTVTVHGLQELDAKFAEIDVVTGQKFLRGSLMFAATPMHKQMKAETPVNTTAKHLKRKSKYGYIKHLDKRAVKWSKKADEKSSATVYVGFKKRAFLAYILEYGATLQRKGKDIGEITPRGWMRRAADQNWNEAVIRFKKALQRRLERLGI